MYRIVIIDDDNWICNFIENTILEYQNQTRTKFDISIFYTGEEFLRFLDEESCIDLLFLDIELFKINGIAIGKRIREQLNDHLTQIIFISAQKKYGMELFNFHPVNFLVKPLKAEEIIKNMEVALYLTTRQTDCFLYKTGKGTQRIPKKDIQYFQSSGHKIEVYTVSGKESFYGKLEDVYETVKDNQFLYIHKSILVNYVHVKQLSYEFVRLFSGVTLPISQSRQKIIRQQSLAFEKDGQLL